MLDYVRQKTTKIFANYEEIATISVAVAIGCATGFGNIIFRSLIEFLQRYFFDIDSEIMLYSLKEASFWKILLIPAFGGLLVGLITHYVKAARVHGVPEVIKAAALRKPISLSSGITKTITAGITLGTGGSAGREGPIVLIGATIGSAIGRLFRFSSSRTRTVLACGAAGGLAATFNAPITGAMFAAEVLLGEFGIKTFSPVIISAVTATVVSRAYYGDDVTFHVPENIEIFIWELPLYAIMGVFIALISLLFIRSYFHVSDIFKKLKIPNWIKPAIGGLLMGVIALFCRNIMGVGYGTINEILSGQIVGIFLFALIFLKILATSLTLGSGGSGGQFVPSLFIGASAGGFFGWLVTLLIPSVTSFGAYALVGMGAMIAAVTHAPITAVFLIFEITQSYYVVLPIIICAIIANVISYRLEKDSIFTWSLTREGFKVGHGIEENVLNSVKVKDIMLTDIITFKEDTNFCQMKASIEKKPHAYFPVVNSKGYLTGMISLNDLKSVFFNEKECGEIKAGDIGVRKNIITVTPDETLSQAMHDFGIKEVGDLPVVIHTSKGMKLVGLLRRSDIIIAYNKKIVDFMPEVKD